MFVMTFSYNDLQNLNGKMLYSVDVVFCKIGKLRLEVIDGHQIANFQ